MHVLARKALIRCKWIHNL